MAVWEFAGLLLTYWCSSRCAICYVCAGPEQGGLMSVAAARALWRSLDDLAAQHGKAMRIHLAGGEPFRDWTRLVAIVRAARDAGLTPLEKIETNASWATDEGLTRARLELLDALGMEKLVISADVFHQEFVPFERVRRCVEVARRVLGRSRVRVRWWDFYNQPIDTRKLSREERATAFRAALSRHRERLSGRAAALLAPLLPLQAAAELAGQNCVREILHSKHVHIDPDGHIFPGTCAGIILGRADVPAGCTVADVWHELRANWPDHPLVSALAAGGSYELMQRVKRLGYEELSTGYAGKCHLCWHVRKFLSDRGHWPRHVGPSACYAAACAPQPSHKGAAL